jgi:hypothetical protein
MPVQLRFATNLTSEQYVSQKAWRRASLNGCPLHLEGSCGFKRHGTYPRREPPGARVPRWYCPTGHTTFSLLPDCLAAKLPGSLGELEQVVDTVEQAPSLEAAADALRPDILLPGRLRWLRRRRDGVQAALAALIALLPEVFNGCEPTLSAVRRRLDTGAVLVALRTLGEAQLPTLPAPLGFGPRSAPGHVRCSRQHDSGPRAPPIPG